MKIPRPTQGENSLPNCEDNNDQSHNRTPMTTASAGQLAPLNHVFENEEDAEERLARGRERNREHARRTRLRKKAQLQSLQAKVKELEAENLVLQQSAEECSVASILLGMSYGESISPVIGSDEVNNCKIEASKVSNCLQPKKRKRAGSDCDYALTININGVDTVIGGNGKSHINWKTGVYTDENGILKQLTRQELEVLRRERNRRHAKMTRDRKKNFIASMNETIAQLEDKNRDLRERISHHSFIGASVNQLPLTVAIEPNADLRGSVKNKGCVSPLPLIVL